MNCDELRDQYDLYALDLTGTPYTSEIRDHLRRECPNCMAGVRSALETLASIGAAAPAAQPSAELRRRILASVGTERRPLSWSFAWAGAALAATAFAIAGVLWIETRKSEQEAAGLRAQSNTQRAEIARLTDAFAILSGPQTTEAAFGGTQPRPPQGRVFVNPARGVLLIATNLPRTPVDKIYEMWLIRKGANPVPAGLFQSQDDGQAMNVRPGAVDVASTAAVAVTIENQAGALLPTSTPLIIAQLARATP